MDSIAFYRHTGWAWLARHLPEIARLKMAEIVDNPAALHLTTDEKTPVTDATGVFPDDIRRSCASLRPS